MEKISKAYIIFVRKPKIERPLGKLRYRWEDNMKEDLKEYGGRVWNRFMSVRVGTSSHSTHYNFTVLIWLLVKVSMPHKGYSCIFVLISVSSN